MKGFIATTDYEWFQYLSSQGDLDEVNFWAPSGKVSRNTVPRYSPFLFKLKTPYNAIGSFGFLGPVTTVPMSMAWEIFGRKNGAPDLRTMAQGIRKYRNRFDAKKTPAPGPYDPPVGWRLILQPVFFPPEEWIHVPSDWSGNIVQGKTYDLTAGEGRRVWKECEARALGRKLVTDSLRQPLPGERPQPQYGAETVYRARLDFALSTTAGRTNCCPACPSPPPKCRSSSAPRAGDLPPATEVTAMDNNSQLIPKLKWLRRAPYAGENTRDEFNLSFKPNLNRGLAWIIHEPYSAAIS